MFNRCRLCFTVVMLSCVMLSGSAVADEALDRAEVPSLASLGGPLPLGGPLTILLL